MEDAKKDIQKELKHCCCIRKIYFTTHSGVPGVITLGDNALVSSEILEKLKLATNEAQKRVIENSIRRQREFLEFLKRKMCKGGKVIFVQCNVAQGPKGKELEEWLHTILGQDVDVTLFEQSIKWFYGGPINCTSNEQ